MLRRRRPQPPSLTDDRADKAGHIARRGQQAPIEAGRRTIAASTAGKIRASKAADINAGRLGVEVENGIAGAS